MSDDITQNRLKGTYSATFPGLMVFEVITPGDITGLRVTSQAVPLGGDVVFDLNVNGVSVWVDPGDRLKILEEDATGEDMTLSEAVVKGDIISVDLDSTPSAIGGSLFITVIITP